MTDYYNIIQAKIFTLPDLKKRLVSWKLLGKKLVFTNGCFDLLHLGHVQYLSQARSLGDKLVVGLNSDVSIKLLKKGKNRPFQDETSRAVVMASLHVVDAVVLFDEENPGNLIEAVNPAILVKGADYTDVSKIAGFRWVKDHGGEVLTLPLAEGYSTSNIEKKILTGN